MNRSPLHTGWTLRRRDASQAIPDAFAGPDWLPAAVPGTAHGTLLEHGLIPDPFHGTNENDVQWVGESDWLYQLHFDAPPPGLHADLVFDGLDTFATVWLNDQEILRTDNMFVPHRVPVGHLLRPTGNTLRLHFESAWHRGLEVQAAHGGPKPLWNGDPSRLHVRKAQYHYGWDWGPKLITAGAWGGIRLETYAARVYDLHCVPQPSDDLTSASVPVALALEGDLAGARATISLRDPDGVEAGRVTLDAAETLEHTFTVGHPRLWWPHTHGEQPLYTVQVTLERDGATLDASAKRVGVRRLRLLEVADAQGSSFTFEVNNVAIFCGGANWIPDDNLLPRITPARYRERIAQAKRANMNMLRVWGGGIYEDDSFYDVCDELGLLVWQDFMFGCGIYPAHEAFVESVKREATANITRLRHHPSLAFWAGNNEDYQLAHGLGLYDPDEAPESAARFPARVIYERVLPELLDALDPHRPYRPGSPWLGRDPDDQTRGDRHTWDVWGRAARPYRDYERLGGRFVSEFGMAGAPHLEHLHAHFAPEERHPHSRTFEHHMKAGEGLRRLNAYITDTQPLPADLAGYVFATQLVQSEALDCAYRIWRRGWGSPEHRLVSGALVWQLNDCWPVTSWAVIDSGGTPKPAYHAIRRALEAVTVSLWPRNPDTEAGRAEVWAVNATLEPVALTLELRAIALDGRELARTQRAVTLAANATTELGDWHPGASEPAVIAARLLDPQRPGAPAVARHVLFPEPWKHHLPHPPRLEIEHDAGRLRLRTDVPVKALQLECDAPLESNNFDLVPGETLTVGVHGTPREVRARYLGGSAVVRVDERALEVGD